jgi:cytochrome c553
MLLAMLAILGNRGRLHEPSRTKMRVRLLELLTARERTGSSAERRRALSVASTLAATLLSAASTAWCNSANAQAPPPSELITQRVKPCTVCHGAQGRATTDGYYPRIAGKPTGYLLNQLLNFRAGRRTFPQMVYFTQFRNDIDLAELAAYFSAQHPPYASPRAVGATPELLARGRSLVFDGDAAARVPGCHACHGTRMLGVNPAVPGLVGLSQDYLQAQLGAWRAGTRAAQAPDCMAVVARRLRPSDVMAVAAWLASQTVPTDATPAYSFDKRPPMQCGSFLSAGEVGSAARSQPPDQTAEQGRQLVILGDCEGCHTARGSAPFAGGRPIDTAFGVFYSPNITPDAATGIGRWSEEDFWHALHDGTAPDGSLLYPVFPYPNYTRVSRADADAIFAYIRTVPPVASPRRAHELHFPYSVRSLLLAWRELYFRPGVYQPDPRHDVQWNRGAYLVEGLAHCGACHEGRNALGATVAPDSREGGLVLKWYAPSLFALREAGLQAWSDAEIVTLLSSGQVAGTTPASHAAVVAGPMAEVVYESLQNVSAPDLEAMAAYLKTLPDIAGATVSASGASGPVELALLSDYDTGRVIYARECGGCHGAEGEGHEPAGPPLVANRATTLPLATNAIRLLLFGGFAPGTRDDPRPLGMPPYYPSLTDVEIAAVLTYVRTSWGNLGSAVSPSEVADNRGSPLW